MGNSFDFTLELLRRSICKNFFKMTFTPTNNQQQDQPSWNNEHARRQEQLYPNLDEILDNILPHNQSQFLRDFFAGRNHYEQQPSAPPSQESVGGWNGNFGQNGQNVQNGPNAQNGQNAQNGPNPQNAQNGQNAPNGQNTQHAQNGPNPQNAQFGQNAQNGQNRQHAQNGPNYPNTQNWNGNEMDELARIFQRLGTQFAQNLTKSLGFLMLFLPILLMPKCLLILGILAAVIKSFGLPLTPLLFTGFLWNILSAFDPVLVSFVAIWVFYKTVLRGKPLIDLEFWRNRCNSRRCR